MELCVLETRAKRHDHLTKASDNVDEEEQREQGQWWNSQSDQESQVFTIPHVLVDQFRDA